MNLGNNNNKRLLSSAATFLLGSSSTRFMKENNNNEGNGYFGNISDNIIVLLDNINPDDLMQYGAGLLLIVLVSMIIYILVISKYKGALVRSAAVTYAGHNPTVSESLTTGRQKYKKIFGFNILLLCINVLAAFVIVIIPTTILSNNDNVEPNNVVIMSSIVLVLVELFINSAMICGEPLIIIEDKSYIMEAARRSWDLFKSNKGLTFTTCFSFFVLEALITIMLHALGRQLDSGVAFVIYAILLTIIGAVSISLWSIIMVVLYMSCRIQMENYTQAKLVEDLKLSSLTTPLVEMTKHHQGNDEEEKEEMKKDTTTTSSTTTKEEEDIV